MVDNSRSAFKQLQSLLRKALKLSNALERPETVQDAAAPSTPHNPSRYHVERYRDTRQFALYDGDELLAVTMYRKGAETVRDRLQALEARLAELTQSQPLQEQGRQEGMGAVKRLHAEREGGTPSKLQICP